MVRDLNSNCAHLLQFTRMVNHRELPLQIQYLHLRTGRHLRSVLSSPFLSSLLFVEFAHWLSYFETSRLSSRRGSFGTKTSVQRIHLLRSLYYRIGGLYFGWRMVAVGAVLRVLGGGLYFYGFSVFFLPLSQDLGLSRASTSLVFSLARAQGAFEGPFAGYFMDRHGPRPLMILAILCAGIGHMLLAGVNSYVMLLLVYMGVVSLAFHAGFMDAPMLIANTWFIRQRTMAMALISGSIGIGGFIFTPFLSMAVHAYGWRPAVSLLLSSACRWLGACGARRRAWGCNRTVIRYRLC